MVILPFIAGYAMRSRIADTSQVSKRIVRINIIIIDPLIVLWSIWGLAFTGHLAFLPAAGIMLALLGFLCGKAFLPLLHLEQPSRKTYLITSSLANHGFTMGGFICYLLAGEKGLGMAAIFVSYFLPFVFLLVFPYAGSTEREKIYTLSFFKKQFINIQNMPLYAVLIAVILHLFDIKRPENVYFPLDALIFTSVILYYLTLGISFDIKHVRSIKAGQFTIGAIKFIIVPLITGIILSIITIDADVEKIILIQSFMPAAIYSVVTSILFDLDIEMASGIFVVNTIVFIIAVLPLLFLFRESLGI